MKSKGAWFNWRKLIIDDRKLSTGAKGIALYLGTYMNDHQDLAWPSLDRIKYEMSYGSKTTVIKYLDELEKRGFIGRIRRFHNTTMYHARIPDHIDQSPENGILEKSQSPDFESQSPENGVHYLDTNNQGINYQDNNQDNTRGETSTKSPPCPHQKIVDLYHEKLPMCPRVVTLSDARKRSLRARWTNGASNLEFWGDYFGHVAESKFLTGKVDPPPGRKQFIADFDFLIRESTIIKTQEGKYHG